MTQTTLPPILVLHEMAQQGRQHAHALPQQIEVKTTWDGIGFKVGELMAVAPLEQVKEILTGASISRIPGARDWVRGIANVRGTLLPILDLQGFLWEKTTKITRQSRILVIQHNGINAGLIVNEVMGMRHFLEEEFNAGVSTFGKTLHNVVTGSYRQGRETWAVLNIHKLVEEPEFLHVAA